MPLARLLTDGAGKILDGSFNVFLGNSLAQTISAANGSSRFYGIDPQGSPILSMGRIGEPVKELSFDGFGKPLSRPLGASLGLETNLGFHNTPWDRATGYQVNLHRFYDNATHQFLSEDPLGLDERGSRYAFAHGNPLKWTDRSGLAVDDALSTDIPVYYYDADPVMVVASPSPAGYRDAWWVNIDPTFGGWLNLKGNWPSRKIKDATTAANKTLMDIASQAPEGALGDYLRWQTAWATAGVTLIGGSAQALAAPAEAGTAFIEANRSLPSDIVVAYDIAVNENATTLEIAEAVAKPVTTVASDVLLAAGVRQVVPSRVGAVRAVPPEPEVNTRPSVPSSKGKTKYGRTTPRNDRLFRKQFMNAMSKKARESLGWDPKTKQITKEHWIEDAFNSKTGKIRGRLGLENEGAYQAGDIITSASGAPHRYFLESPELNNMSSWTESTGSVFVKEGVLIDGYPLERATAMQKERMGTFPNDTVETAPSTSGWIPPSLLPPSQPK